MGKILAGVLILILSLSVPIVYAERDQIDVVFVNTDRGSFNDTDTYLEYVDNALEFWDISPAISVSTQYHAKAYANLEWVDLYKDIPTLYIVYTNGSTLASGKHGTASYDFMFAITTSSSPWPEATIAHEFGHLIFGLPDLYLDDDCSAIDIMCNHVAAYKLNRIGCDTLANLGKPCSFVSFPLIHAAP